VAECWLHETVCTQRPEIWPIVGYMKLCVDRDLNCGRVLVTKTVCRQLPELWLRFGYMKLCVHRDLNSGRVLVT